MKLTGGEPVLGQVNFISVECSDCGRGRWRKPSELIGRSVTLLTPVSVVCSKFTCSACLDEGMPGKNIAVRVAFVDDAVRIKAEAFTINSREVLSRGSRAIYA